MNVDTSVFNNPNKNCALKLHHPHSCLSGNRKTGQEAGKSPWEFAYAGPLSSTGKALSLGDRKWGPVPYSTLLFSGASSMQSSIGSCQKPRSDWGIPVSSHRSLHTTWWTWDFSSAWSQLPAVSDSEVSEKGLGHVVSDVCDWWWFSLPPDVLSQLQMQ
jgi:hypothetical protein